MKNLAETGNLLDAHNRGFTLLEMLIAVMIITILLSLAVPSYRKQILDGRITAATNDLVGTLMSARAIHPQPLAWCQYEPDTPLLCSEQWRPPTSKAGWWPGPLKMG